METIQIIGQPIDAAKLKRMLFVLANTVSRKADIIGSIDQNRYGTQLSFVLNGEVIGLSVMKGGTL